MKTYYFKNNIVSRIKLRQNNYSELRFSYPLSENNVRSLIQFNMQEYLVEKPIIKVGDVVKCINEPLFNLGKYAYLKGEGYQHNLTFEVTRVSRCGNIIFGGYHGNGVMLNYLIKVK